MQPDQQGLSVKPRAFPWGKRPRHPLAALKSRDFRFLWFSVVFTSSATALQQVTVGWLAYDMTRSAVLVAAVESTYTLPFLLVGPLAGVLVDRVDRRKLLLVSQSVLVLLALAFAIAVNVGAIRVWHLFPFTFLTGVGWAFNTMTRQAMQPSLVPRSELLNANVLNALVFNVVLATVPLGAGYLMVTVGPASNLYLEAGMFLGVIGMVSRLRPVPPAGPARRASVAQTVVEGIRYVGARPSIFGVIAVAVVPALFLMPFVRGLMPIFAGEVLQQGPQALGALFSALGWGSLTAMLALAFLGDVRRKGLLLLTMALAAGVMLVVFSRLAWLPAALAALYFVGLCHMMYIVTTETSIQAATPDGYRGRVMSIFMLSTGMAPLGGVLAGFLAQAFSVPLALLVGGIATVLLVLALGLRFRGLSQLGGNAQTV
ncbi:MAG: MFS transporter [Chloroflexi bacterium]|nr:MFS transporter [Chloroflexota bacterium]